MSSWFSAALPEWALMMSSPCWHQRCRRSWTPGRRAEKGKEKVVIKILRTGKKKKTKKLLLLQSALPSLHHPADQDSAVDRHYLKNGWKTPRRNHASLLKMCWRQRNNLIVQTKPKVKDQSCSRTRVHKTNRWETETSVCIRCRDELQID